MFNLISLPSETKAGVEAIFIFLVSEVVKKIVAKFPNFEYLQRFSTAIALLISGLLIATIEQFFPTDYDNLAVAIFNLIFAVLAAAGIGKTVEGVKKLM